MQGPQVQFLLQPYIFVAFVCSFILFDYTGFYFTHFLLIFHQMHVIPFSEELFESLYRKKFQKNILFLSWDADMIYILVKGKIKLLKSNLKFWEHFSQFFKIIIIVNSFLSQWKIPVEFWVEFELFHVKLLSWVHWDVKFKKLHFITMPALLYHRETLVWYLGIDSLEKASINL